MTRSEILTAAREALSRVAPESTDVDLDPAVNLGEQLEIDSMDFVSFVLELEKDLGLRVPELDYPRLSSLEGCVTYFLGRSPAGSDPDR